MTSPLERAALYVEEGSWLGQLLDLDVAGPGGLVGRSDLCLPPRACVVCGGTATACSGRAPHPAATVDAAFARILARATDGHHPGSPDGSAVGDYPSLNI
jgi:phosphoribosyl-dephospho-CoA transferase